MSNRSYAVKLLPSARRDLLSIAVHIATDKPRTALKYLERLRLRLHSLSSHPRMGHLPKDPYLKSKGYRILIVDAYLAFYVLQKNTVKIHRILHGSRDIQSIVFK